MAINATFEQSIGYGLAGRVPECGADSRTQFVITSAQFELSCGTHCSYNSENRMPAVFQPQVAYPPRRTLIDLRLH